MKHRGVFGILISAIKQAIWGRSKHSTDSFVPTDSLLGAVNPFSGHHHTRRTKRTGGAFGNKARMARFARRLDPVAVRRAIKIRDEIEMARKVVAS